MTDAPIRLFFVDDHPVVATGLALRFGATPGFVVVGTSASVQGAQDIVVGGGVDVVVLDLHLEVTVTPRQVAALCAHSRVVLFSGHAGDAIVAQLKAAGAAAAVDKAAPFEGLDDVLRDVHAGRMTTTTAMTTTATSTMSSAEARLSAREREVYRALARCQTPKEVAADLGIATSTVYCHIDRIRQKLGLQTVPEIVALALSSPR